MECWRKERSAEREFRRSAGSPVRFELSAAQGTPVRKLTDAGQAVGRELERIMSQKSHKTESNFSSHQPE